LLRHRYQLLLGNVRSRCYNLPLRRFVDGVDVINAFDAILVALMYGVDPQIAGSALWTWLAPFPDWDRCRPRRLIAGVLAAIPYELRNR
jgi:hypothetical protein